MNETHYRRSSSCRIVIGFDAAASNDRSIDAATRLAAVVEGEVIGLFAEDEASMNLAQLPFAKAFAVGQMEPTPLTADAMQAAFSRQAAICRKALSDLAEKSKISWSFEHAKGDLLQLSKKVISAGDFFVVSLKFFELRTKQLFSELRTAPADIRGIIVANAQRQAGLSDGPVVAFDDGDRMGEATISLAVQIAARTGRPLHLFTIAASEKERARIIAKAEQLAGSSAHISPHNFAPGTMSSVAAALMHLKPSFLIADLEGEPFHDDATAIALIRAAQAPTILLRPL